METWWSPSTIYVGIVKIINWRSADYLFWLFLILVPNCKQTLRCCQIAHPIASAIFNAGNTQENVCCFSQSIIRHHTGQWGNWGAANAAPSFSWITVFFGVIFWGLILNRLNGCRDEIVRVQIIYRCSYLTFMDAIFSFMLHLNHTSLTCNKVLNSRCEVSHIELLFHENVNLSFYIVQRIW